MLKRIHYSSFMGEVYQGLPFLKDMAEKVYRIYKGSSDLMTNRLYWQLYLVFKYLSQDCKLLYKSRIMHMRLPIDEARVIYINPARIQFALLPSAGKQGKVTPVEDGNWDLERERLEDMATFQAIQEYFTKSLPLPGAKYQQIDQLFHTIKETGYKTQEQLSSPEPDDEVTVAIDHSGKFLLENGMVRLAIAKILGLSNIPVIVTRRHYQWAKFRKEVFDYSQEQAKGAYQMPIHPDLQKIRSHRKEDRWELMANNLPVKTGTVLDIGANWGYFCHKFEDLSFECYAVENNYRWLYFLKKLRGIENKKFEIIASSVFDIKRKQYDVVLALSIFHHFLRSKVLYGKLTKLLGELDMKVMYFEPHEIGRGFPGAYIDYNETEFVDYILRHSCLSKYQLLGRNERGRNLYLLSAC
jgi:hypothetical protein